MNFVKKIMGRIYSREQLIPVIGDIQLHLGIINGRVDYVEHYRGQGLDTYRLMSGISRYKHKPCNLIKRERKLFEKFVAKATNGIYDFIQEPYHQNTFSQIKNWHILYQAQHLGIKTRLMDWSGDWEVALYFAVEDEKLFGKDGQFWVFICPRQYVVNSGNFGEIYNVHPLEINQSYMINGAYYASSTNADYVGERRRLRQRGKFFIQPLIKGLIPLEAQDEFKPFLRKFIIDGYSKERIKNELIERGLSSELLYYRKDENIDTRIKHLNNIFMKRCRVG